jgi:aryl-alcohol dehydrogenase-like predicted oxidoreductase
MEYRTLGNTGFEVSRLCFGTLTISPLQARLSLQEGTAVIRAALAAGVNFLDTAELYQNYDTIRTALQGQENSVYLCSKSYAYTYDGMQQSVETACRATGRDYIDIFMMHEQTSRLTLKGHQEALQYLVAAKQAGLVRAIGVSTHTVEVVRAAALYDEIDVIHPILNSRGIGICDGSVADMQAAILFAADMGKGIYTMKALGGGHLSPAAAVAFSWIREQRGIAAVAVGMQSVAEVEVNCAIFSGLQPNDDAVRRVSGKPRRLLVEDWCVGCGRCVDSCPMGAIQVVAGQAVPDRRKCVLCGYCGAHCPEFCIKVI